MSTQMIDTKPLEQEIAPIVTMSTSLTIATPEQRTSAMQLRGRIKGAQKRVKEFWSPIKEAAHAAWKKTTEGERQFLEPLELADRLATKEITRFDNEQEEIRLEKERKLQAEADERARREREKAEQAATEQRRIEAEARERAEVSRRAAAAADETNRKRLLEEAQAADRQATKAAAKAESREDQAAAVIAPTVSVASTVEKTKGESYSTKWEAVLVSEPQLIKAAADGNSAALSLLLFDQSAADRLATATKGTIEIPGVKFEFRRILRQRTS